MLTAANPLQPEGVTVRSALSSVGVFGPVFIDGTITSGVYLSLLSDEFVPFLMGYGVPMNSAWYQQDGATSHTDNTVLLFHEDVLEKRICRTIYCSLWGRILMDTYLAGLKPFWLFSVNVFEGYNIWKSPHTFLELKTTIQSEIEATSAETLTKILKTFLFAWIS
jgi:hypothetical protein